MEHVEDSALEKQLVEIRLLRSGIEIFRRRGESWKMGIRGEIDVLGFHRKTKSQICFNKVMALHSIAVKETSSSARLTRGSFKKRATVPTDCAGFTTWAYAGEKLTISYRLDELRTVAYREWLIDIDRPSDINSIFVTRVPLIRAGRRYRKQKAPAFVKVIGRPECSYSIRRVD